MQAVQLEQLIPQIQLQSNSPQELKSGDSTFLDLLHFHQQEIQDEEKMQESEQKAGIEANEYASAKETEKENSPEKEQTVPVQFVKEEEAPLVVNYNFSGNERADLRETEKLPAITEQQIKWLKQPAVAGADESTMSEQDFEKMIDAAVEFVPGELSQEELLEKAQNLSSKDPELFLKQNVQTVASQNVTEKDIQLNLADKDLFIDKSKNQERKAEKKDLKIEVTDLRTKKIDSQSQEIQVGKVNSRKDYELTYKKESENSFQITVELAEHANQNITSSSTQSAQANGSTFQSMIANAVQENAFDFVKASNVILKDNNQGSINLILHPQKLGNVKIELNLSEKLISGSITVQSKEAYEAMKDSIASLKSAFSNSGFETGEFNLNFNNSNSQFAQGQGHNGENQQAMFQANKNYSDYVSNIGQISLEDSVLSYEKTDDYSVNIVA